MRYNKTLERNIIHYIIEKRFNDNKLAIQSIAKQKIENGESNIFVSCDNVRSKDV